MSYQSTSHVFLYGSEDRRAVGEADRQERRTGKPEQKIRGESCLSIIGWLRNCYDQRRSRL